MPFFANASKFSIKNGEMNEVAGDINKTQTTNTTSNVNSHNKVASTTTGAYNSLSKDGNTYSPSYSSNAQTTPAVEQNQSPKPATATPNPKPTSATPAIARLNNPFR